MGWYQRRVHGIKLAFIVFLYMYTLSNIKYYLIRLINLEVVTIFTVWLLLTRNNIGLLNRFAIILALCAVLVAVGLRLLVSNNHISFAPIILC